VTSAPELIAASEDEPIAWITRLGCTRNEAVRIARAHVGDDSIPLGAYKARARFMRPAKCEVHPDGRDALTEEQRDAEELDDAFACQCSYVYDGWYFECPRTHPEAIPVWRVEELA
jgi:hypothetical protein